MQTKRASEIRENLAHVREEIRKACLRSGRDPKAVTLIAVSKTMPFSDIELALDAGQTVFGENRVQEMVQKAALAPETASWHMIGHLQTNKVRQAVGCAVLIHSVDSAALARKIDQVSREKQTVTPVLIEVNVADEASKFGIRPGELEAMIREISKLPHIRIRGLMTVAPYTPDPESNRPVFQKLRQLAVDITRKNIDNVDMSVLSMGMSGDYVVAVEEGATMVRVGTGIFGERTYASPQLP